MSGWASFQREDGSWWTYDTCEVVETSCGEANAHESLERLLRAHSELVAKGWQKLKLSMGGRYDEFFVIRGVRPESPTETAERLRSEERDRRMAIDREKAEYERLKKIYG